MHRAPYLGAVSIEVAAEDEVRMSPLVARGIVALAFEDAPALPCHRSISRGIARSMSESQAGRGEQNAPVSTSHSRREWSSLAVHTKWPFLDHATSDMPFVWPSSVFRHSYELASQIFAVQSTGPQYKTFSHYTAEVAARSAAVGLGD
eukprot:scaffold1343_cov369-Prasinococcus_capsulatus_cf.AAC.5